MPQGYVKFYRESNGYGFIVPDEAGARDMCVILFCAATGTALAPLASPRTQCSPWRSRDSSSTIARPATMRSRTADARRSLRSLGMRG